MLYEGIPVILGFTLTLRYYIRAYKALKRLPKSFVQQMNLRKSKLLLYPSILILSFLPCVIDNVYDIMGPIDSQRHGIRLMRVLVSNSIGLINAIMYGMQRKIYKIEDPEKYEELEDGSYYSTESFRGESLKSLQSELVKAQNRSYMSYSG